MVHIMALNTNVSGWFSLRILQGILNFYDLAISISPVLLQACIMSWNVKTKAYVLYIIPLCVEWAVRDHLMDGVWNLKYIRFVKL